MTAAPALGLVLATAIATSAVAATDFYKITPQEHAAYDGDATRLCMASYPDENRMLSCMQANHRQLTPLCVVVFDAGIKRRHLQLRYSAGQD